MTKKQKLEEQRYKNSAMIHTKKRLCQRYPKIYRVVSYADLKTAPYLRLFPTRETSRIVTAVLVKGYTIYTIQSLAKNMIHTVLTEAQVQELITEGNLGITLEESALKTGIESKYKTYTRYIDALEQGEIG